MSDLGLSIQGQTWINLTVETCQDANINLLKNGEAISRIKLGRGANSWSNTEKADGSIQNVRYDAILNCTEFVPFWVSWDQGNVQIGKGLSRNQDVYMGFTDADFAGIDDVSVGSYSAVAKWNMQIGKYVH